MGANCLKLHDPGHASHPALIQCATLRSGEGRKRPRHTARMTEKDTLRELNDLIARAMEQPGVTDVMRVYEEARAATEPAQQAMNLLRQQWVYQSTDTSS